MIKNLYKIGNAVDDIYTKIAGVPYPVSAAVGKKPIPEPVEVTTSVTYTETEENVWKMELTITFPEGTTFDTLTTQFPDWGGSVVSGEKEVTFNADDITVDYITVTDLTIDSVPSDNDECSVVIMNGDVELFTSTTAAHVVEIPVPVEKFTLDSVVLDGPSSAGPYSNVYGVMMSITFTDTPPTNWDQTATCTCTNVCVADTTGEIKDTGEYTFTGFAVNGNLWETNDPAYPYDSPLGPATVTIYDENNDVWATATTDNVTIIGQ